MASPMPDRTAVPKGTPRARSKTLDGILDDREEMRSVVDEIRELARKTGTVSIPEHSSFPQETHVMGAQESEKASSRESGIPAPTGSLRTMTPRKKLATSVSTQSLKGTAMMTPRASVSVESAAILMRPPMSLRLESEDTRPSLETAAIDVIVRDFADFTPSRSKLRERRRVALRLNGVAPSTPDRPSLVTSDETPSVSSHHDGSASLGDGMILGTPPSTLKDMQKDLEHIQVKYREMVESDVFLGRKRSADTQALQAGNTSSSQPKTIAPKVIGNRKTVSDLPPLRHHVSQGHLGASLQKPRQANAARASSPSPAKSTRREHTMSVPRVSRPSIFDMPPPSTSTPYRATLSKTATHPAPHKLLRTPTPKILLRPTVSHHHLENENIDNTPLSVPRVADALEISSFVRELHARDPYINPPSACAAEAVVHTTTPPGSRVKNRFSPHCPENSSALDVPFTLKPNAPQNLTSKPAPTGSTHPRSTPPKPTTRPRNPNFSPRFTTPRNRRIPEDKGASVTPSKECASALDRALDEQILAYEREGREVLPSGQRIDELLEKRFGSAGTQNGGWMGVEKG